jgi:hypothetical protein
MITAWCMIGCVILCWVAAADQVANGNLNIAVAMFGFGLGYAGLGIFYFNSL